MMIRRYVALVLFLLVIGLLSPLPASHAQAGPNFWVYLFNHDTKTFVSVNPLDASSSTFTLNLPAAFADRAFLPQAYSPDGTRLALCFDSDEDPYTPSDLSLLIFDLPSGAVLNEYAIGIGSYCDVTAAGWAADNSTFTFGVLNRVAEGDGPVWTLNTLDLATNSVTQFITSDDPAVTGLGYDFTGFFPTVRWVAPGQMVTFMVFPFGVGGAFAGSGFLWRPAEGTLEASEIFGGADLSVLGSEVLWLDENPAFAGINPIGDGPTFNEVMFSDKTGESHPLYIDRGLFICGAKYVDGGRKVAILTCSFDYTEYVWRFVDRTGGGTTLPIEDTCNFSVNSLIGTPNGYLVLKCDDQNGAELERHIFNGTNAVPDVGVLWFDPTGHWSIASAPLPGDLGGSGWPNAQ